LVIGVVTLIAMLIANLWLRILPIGIFTIACIGSLIGPLAMAVAASKEIRQLRSTEPRRERL
jgi:hypothetical protein